MRLESVSAAERHRPAVWATGAAGPVGAGLLTRRRPEQVKTAAAVAVVAEPCGAPEAIALEVRGQDALQAHFQASDLREGSADVPIEQEREPRQHPRVVT